MQEGHRCERRWPGRGRGRRAALTPEPHRRRRFKVAALPSPRCARFRDTAGTVTGGHAHHPDPEEPRDGQHRPAPHRTAARYLRQLAQRSGTTFTNPRTRRQASAEIRRLKTIRATGFTFAELHSEQADRADHGDVPIDYSPTFTPEETVGYGASATWSQRA